jgi:hypothetical protein
MPYFLEFLRNSFPPFQETQTYLLYSSSTLQAEVNLIKAENPRHSNIVIPAHPVDSSKNTISKW